MPTPSVRGVGAVASEVSNVISCVAPTCMAGDLLVATIVTDQVVASSPPTPPTGWAQMLDGNLRSPEITNFTKTAVSGDSGSTFNFTLAATNPGIGAITAYKDVLAVDTTYIVPLGSPLATTSAQTNAGGSTLVTSKPNELVVATFGIRGTTTISSSPSTSRIAQNPVSVGGSEIGMQISDRAQTIPGPATVQTLVVSAAAHFAVAMFSLYGNDPPNAPNWLQPASGSTVDLTQASAWAAQFSDPDAGDFVNGYDFRYSSDGGATWTTISQTSHPSESWSVPAATFTAGGYIGQVRFYDQHSNVGAWSASLPFTAAVPPAGPTVTAPSSGDVEHDATVAVTWTAASQTAYQVRILGDDAGDPDPTNVLYDSGQLDGATQTLVVPLTVNSIDAHIQVSIEASGLWSSFTDVPISVDWTAPPAPTLTLATFNPRPDQANRDSAFRLTYTTPAHTGDQPLPEYADIYLTTDGGTTETRVATGMPTSGFWNYMVPQSGLNYWFKVLTVAESGVTGSSGWVATPDVAAFGVGTFGIGVFGVGYYEGVG